MARCKLWVSNRTEQTISSLVMWHTPSMPTPADFMPNLAVINATAIGHERGVAVEIDLPASPFDFWMLGCQFEGGTETFAMCNLADMPFKEFAVSDGDWIDFVIGKAGIPYHYPVDVKHNGDYSATARVINVKEILALELVAVLMDAFGA